MARAAESRPSVRRAAAYTPRPSELRGSSARARSNAARAPSKVRGWRKVRTNPRAIHASETRSEEHTSELQSRPHLVCRLLLEKKKNLNLSPIKYLLRFRHGSREKFSLLHRIVV